MHLVTKSNNIIFNIGITYCSKKLYLLIVNLFAFQLNKLSTKYIFESEIKFKNIYPNYYFSFKAQIFIFLLLKVVFIIKYVVYGERCYKTAVLFKLSRAVII